MSIGSILIEFLTPHLQELAHLMPGEWFPYYFSSEIFHRPLIASFIVAIVSGFLGMFLLIRNLALIGDGLAHVSFGGVAIGLVLGSVAPLWYALFFGIVAAITIDILQTKNILTGDASIAIFLTGTLGLGLVVLRIWGGASYTDIEKYLFGDINLVDSLNFDIILVISLIGYVSMIVLYHSLLSIAIDPVAARIQGIPVRSIGLYFSVITAAVVVSMVQIVGVLLVTALLVTPAATAQLIGKSFRSCVILAQIIGVVTVFLGLYFSAENDTGAGEMIALISALIFAAVAILQLAIRVVLVSKDNTI